jgi:protein tyrosine phosphatase
MSLDVPAIKQEFAKLTALTTKPRSSIELKYIHQSANLFCNKTKNRYGDVLPVEETIVRLAFEPGREGSDYINANFVRGEFSSSPCFICCQAPLPQTFEDFWRMVWEQNAPVIVVLMRMKENGRIKGHMYWPNKLKETKQFGKIRVTLKKSFTFRVANQLAQIKIRVLEIENLHEKKSREIVQLHFKGWPDFGVPDTTRPIRELIHLTNMYRQTASQKGVTGPTVVHCSAGIGRTGAFLAISVALEKLYCGTNYFNENKPDHNGGSRHIVLNTNTNFNASHAESCDDVDMMDVEGTSNCVAQRLKDLSRCYCNNPLGVNILDIVLSLRRQRNRGMVQTEEQYLFVHQTIFDELRESTVCFSPASTAEILEQIEDRAEQHSQGYDRLSQCGEIKFNPLAEYIVTSPLNSPPSPPCSPMYSSRKRTADEMNLQRSHSLLTASTNLPPTSPTASHHHFNPLARSMDEHVLMAPNKKSRTRRSSSTRQNPVMNGASCAQEHSEISLSSSQEFELLSVDYPSV